MKLLSNILSFTMLATLLWSCGLDNYDEPKSKLYGKVTYNGEALGLRGTGEAIQMQLYQDGFELRDPITVYVGQEGTFEALLFDGEYKLVTKDKNGPWVNTRDTMVVNLKGSTQCEVKVTPYFTISGDAISLNGNTLSATCAINKVVATANIDRVMLLLSKTSFVDEVNNIARKDFSGMTAGNASLSMDLTGNANVASAKALYARIGVKTSGADQAIYSKVIKLK